MDNEEWMRLSRQALYQAHIYRHNCNYEDYQQIALEEGWKIIQKKPDAKKSYLLQAMIWRIQDEKYRAQRRSREIATAIEEQNQPTTTFCEEEELFWDLLYYEVQEKLTQIEWIILHHYFHYGETLQEIAGHSPYTLYQLHYWKKKCLLHLQQFYQKEKVGD